MDKDLPLRRKPRVTFTQIETGAPPEGSPEFFARLRAEHTVHPRDRKIKDWVRYAAAEQIRYGLTDREICQRYKKSVSSWERYKRSEEFKQWRETLQENASDPVKVTQAVSRELAPQALQTLQVTLDAALGLGLWDLARKCSKDILQIAGIPEEKKAPEVVVPTLVFPNVTPDRLARWAPELLPTADSSSAET